MNFLTASLTSLFGTRLDRQLGSLSKLEIKLDRTATTASDKAWAASDRATEVMAKAAVKAAESRAEAAAQEAIADRARRVARKVRGLID